MDPGDADDAGCDSLPPGSLMVLEHLSSAEFNGLVCETVDGAANGRVGVRLKGSGKLLSVRPTNLRPVSAVEPATAEPGVNGSNEREDSVLHPPLDCSKSCRKPDDRGHLLLGDDDEGEEELDNEEEAPFDPELDIEPRGAEVRRSRLSMFFLFLFVGPTVGGAYLMLQEWMFPLVRSVPPEDVAQVNDIFFGGNLWLVSCVNSRSGRSQPPKVLTEAAGLLRVWGMRTARVHCWKPVDFAAGKQTLAKRFGFRTKPPVVMVTTGHGQPILISATGLSAQALADRAHGAVATRRSKSETEFGVAPDAKSERPRRRERVGKRPSPDSEAELGNFQDEGPEDPGSTDELDLDEM